MCSFVLDEFNKTLDRTVSRVFDGLGFLSGRVQFDGRESANVIGNIIEGGIAFGDNDLIGVTGIRSCKSFVFGSKSFAVSTLFRESELSRRTYPWSIEFKEDILAVVKDNVLVVVSHNNGDWAFLCFWNGFTLDTGEHGSI
jgi:hypothetical protein